jgi:hypothetical protein
VLDNEIRRGRGGKERRSAEGAKAPAYAKKLRRGKKGKRQNASAYVPKEGTRAPQEGTRIRCEATIEHRGKIKFQDPEITEGQRSLIRSEWAL